MAGLGSVSENMNAVSDSSILLLLGRIDGKLDAAITQGQANTNELKAQDQRISKLERWRAWWFGMAAAAGGLGATGATQLFGTHH
jgi:hypothetical protein